ncbi:MAG: CAP domain-containing protein [Methanolinea sp.]|nr:CAP domain-containing protein [Methanolinea sp.]
MARGRSRRDAHAASKALLAVSLLVLSCAFLVPLPPAFSTAGLAGIVASFFLFGIEGYSRAPPGYRSPPRLAAWLLVPALAALFAYSRGSDWTVLGAHLSSLAVLGLLACAAASVSFHRRRPSRALAIAAFVAVSALSAFTLAAAISPQSPLPPTGMPGDGKSPVPPTLPPPGTTARTPPRTPSPVPPPRVDTPADTAKIEQEIYRLANAERAKAGLPALAWDGRLAEVAREHSRDMAAGGYFSHTNPRGEGPDERAARHGYPTRKPLPGGAYMVGIGENIGKMPTGKVLGIGYVPPDAGSIARAQVQSWMASPGHRANILDPDYTVTGVGVAYDGSLYYVSTQDFQ